MNGRNWKDQKRRKPCKKCVNPGACKGCRDYRECVDCDFGALSLTETSQDSSSSYKPCRCDKDDSSSAINSATESFSLRGSCWDKESCSKSATGCDSASEECQQIIDVCDMCEVDNKLKTLDDCSNVVFRLHYKAGCKTCYRFPSPNRKSHFKYISHTKAKITIVGDDRPVVGMSYTTGAQNDMGFRFPEPRVARELGAGANPVISFGTNYMGNFLKVEFTTPSSFNGEQPQNPDFKSLKHGDTIRVWNPVEATNSFGGFSEIMVAGVGCDRNVIYYCNPYVPPVEIKDGFTITILPAVKVCKPGQETGIFSTLGEVEFKGIHFANEGDDVALPPVAAFDFIQLQANTLYLNNNVFDVSLYNTARESQSSQPNAVTKRFVVNAATHPFFGLLTFVGPKSVLWSETNATSWFIFSTWAGSNNDLEIPFSGCPDFGQTPKAANILVNGAKMCNAWSSYIACPTAAIDVNASYINVQHARINGNYFNGAGAAQSAPFGIKAIYGSRVSSSPLPKFPDVATAPTLVNVGVAIIVFYGSHAVVPGLILNLSSDNITADNNGPAPKGVINNWVPYSTATAAAKYGSTIYHTIPACP